MTGHVQFLPPRWQRRRAAWHRVGSGARESALDSGNRVKGVALGGENVVVVRFTEPSKAYQALSVLKDCDASGRIGLESAAVVERTATGELRIPESADNVGLEGTASGSLIGMLIGVLGGPVGVLPAGAPAR